MNPRTLKDGGAWYIELTWPDGRVDNLRSAGVAAGRVWGNSSSCQRQMGPYRRVGHGFAAGVARAGDLRGFACQANEPPVCWRRPARQPLQADRRAA